MDYSLKLFSSLIKRMTPASQCTSEKSIAAGWTMHYTEFPWLEGIIESMKKDGEYSVSRNDLIRTNDKRERLIKIIFWGFPNAYRSNWTLRNILLNVNRIITLLPDYGARLREDDYLSLFDALNQIDGMKESTISKILCFWEIKVASSEAIIVDQFVRECSHLFYELWGTSVLYPYSAEDNLFVVKKVNRLSRKIGATPQQLECFLFNTGKVVKANRLSLFRQLLQFSGVNVSEDTEEE